MQANAWPLRCAFYGTVRYALEMRGDVDALAAIFAVAVQELPIGGNVLGGVHYLRGPLLQLSGEVGNVEGARGGSSH